MIAIAGQGCAEWGCYNKWRLRERINGNGTVVCHWLRPVPADFMTAFSAPRPQKIPALLFSARNVDLIYAANVWVKKLVFLWVERYTLLWMKRRDWITFETLECSREIVRVISAGLVVSHLSRGWSKWSALDARAINRFLNPCEQSDRRSAIFHQLSADAACGYSYSIPFRALNASLLK